MQKMWGDSEVRASRTVFLILDRELMLFLMFVVHSFLAAPNKQKRAASLEVNDPLSVLLFQICSPAHIPWGDQRWHELLHGYDVWVHIENTGQESCIIHQACQSMARHAATSSNLAALSLHVTRMLTELVHDCYSPADTNATAPSQDLFSKRISRVAKARAISGGLQLLRILLHSVITRSCGEQHDVLSTSSLDEALTYHTRGDLARDTPAGMHLVHALLDFISISGHQDTQLLATPEMYDALVFSFQLLLVFCSTQLYQPFVSSFQEPPLSSVDHYAFHLLYLQEERHQRDEERLFHSSHSNNKTATQHWTPQSVLTACMEWQIRRPPAPEKSIVFYYHNLAQIVARSKGETLGPDGMYESHLVVLASHNDSQSSQSSQVSENSQPLNHQVHKRRGSGNMILEGVLVLSSSIILLPFRLLSLVLGVWGHRKDHHSASSAASKKFHAASTRTKDVLWLSGSALADLSSCLVLLLVNNQRNKSQVKNPFQIQLHALVDNRWDNANPNDESSVGLPDLPALNNNNNNGLNRQSSGSMSLGEFEDDEQRAFLSAAAPLSPYNGQGGAFMLNFESLFVSFGRTLHNEVGALMLYTLLQSSPAFAESLAVRSDLDTLVMPLLRTLYFASASRTYAAQDFSSKGTAGPSNNESSSHPSSASNNKQLLNIRSCPFRSSSQLYVIIILLLLFSQDSSFGSDVFRRITVPHVVWYKERHLKNINLGSVLLLTLLRSLMFNLGRLQDTFLLSNCCAVLMNLSPAMVDLHEYAAMRLASVTVSVMKRYVKLHGEQQSGGDAAIDQEDDMSTPLGMYREVSRTLLGLLKHCVSSRNMERNLHLVYALVYHQSDLQRLFKADKAFTKSEINGIQLVTSAAFSVIQKEGARSAPKALKVLENHAKEILQAIDDPKKHVGKRKDQDDFTFTYEEEGDPEIFFVPYAWEVIVCVVTSSSVEWDKPKILVFPLLEEVEEPEAAEGTNEEFVQVPAAHQQYATDVNDLV
jgi:hypothetical protein